MTNPYIKFSLVLCVCVCVCVCVDDVVRPLERVQIFISAEGLKIEFFLALSYRESSLVQTFCESCVCFDFTHSSVHMAWRFVITPRAYA